MVGGGESTLWASQSLLRGETTTPKAPAPLPVVIGQGCQLICFPPISANQAPASTAWAKAGGVIAFTYKARGEGEALGVGWAAAWEERPHPHPHCS